MPSALKLAVVGGGPSAFYVASKVLALLPDLPAVAVHMYDRLWSPHGLVRYGVAPDHPEVKNCTHKFDTVAQDQRFRFFGNVNIVSPAAPAPRTLSHTLNLPLQSLLDNYTHLLLASGSALPVVHPRLGVSSTCVPALDIVHWYTQHPFQRPPPRLKGTSHMTIIGHGNVSLDIARILLTDPSALSKYDLPESVLQHLSESDIKHISIVGRRDPASVKFTAKELRELMHIPDVSMVPIPAELFPTAGTTLTRQQSRILDILRAGSKAAPGTTTKTVSLDFMRSPAGMRPDGKTIHFDVTRLDAEGAAQATGEVVDLQTDYTVMSMGYAGEPMAADAAGSWFDAKLGHLRTRAGRVHTAPDVQLKGVFASGWAANGARGVLNTTMMDAYAVAQQIVADYRAECNMPDQNNALPDGVQSRQEVMNRLASLTALPPEVLPALHQQGGAGRVFSYDDWKVIDRVEQERGAKLGKERERIGYWDAVRTLEEQKRP